MATNPDTTRTKLTLLRTRLAIHKAKGGKGFSNSQPRHPAGSSLGGQWMGSGSKGSLAQALFGSLFGSSGAKALADPNWSHYQEKLPPAHTYASKNAVLHPHTDDKGRKVYIHKPKTPTGPGQFEGKDKVVTVTPGSQVPKALNGIPFTKWGGPKDGDWTKVAGQNPAAEAGMPDLAGHKWKHPAAGVIVMEPDGRVWLTSPTNKFGGYKNTFPKGTQEHGLSLQQTAIKEAWEETGLKVKITGVLGDFERTNSIARVYLAERVGGSPADQGWESQAMRLVPRSAMKSFLNMPVDKEIHDMLWEEFDLSKRSPTALDLASLQARIDAISKAKGGGGKQGHWTQQPRWPAGSPLGGQWKAYDANGLTKPPVIGSKANPGYQNKVNSAYDAVASGNTDMAVLILKPLELKALELGATPSPSGVGHTYPKHGNSQQKWAMQAHQYVTDLLASKAAATGKEAVKDTGAKPPSLADYKKIGPKPGGSNPGGVYTDKTGEKWLVKGANHPSDDRAKNEVLASKLMLAAGIGAPDMHLVDLQGEHGGGLGVAAKMEDMQHWSKANAQHLDKAQSEFAVHAWLANYDAVGLPAGDNLAMKNGAVFNYDPGGALLYRAQGLPKSLPGGMLATSVTEWDGMRNKSVNAAAASVYGSMTQDQLKASAEKVAAVSDATIKQLVAAYGPGDAKAKDKLAAALIARKADIAARAAGLTGAATAPVAVSVAAAAPIAPAAPQAAPAAATGVLFEAKLTNTEPGHNKFWNVSVTANADGSGALVKSWGKIGTAGQSQTIPFSDAKGALAAAQGQTNVKLAKGYLGSKMTDPAAIGLAAATKPVPKAHDLYLPPETPKGFEVVKAGNGSYTVTFMGKAVNFGGEEGWKSVGSAATLATAAINAPKEAEAQVKTWQTLIGTVMASENVTATEKANTEKLLAWGESITGVSPKGPSLVVPKDAIADSIFAATGIVPTAPLGKAVSEAASAVTGNQYQYNSAMGRLHQIIAPDYVSDGAKASGKTAVDILNQNAMQQGKTPVIAPTYGNHVLPGGQTLLTQAWATAMANDMPGVVKMHDALAAATTATAQSEALANIKQWVPASEAGKAAKDLMLQASTEIVVTMHADGMKALALSDISAKPTGYTNWGGIKGGKQAMATAMASTSLVTQGLKTGDMAMVQKGYDQLKAMKEGFGIGTKARAKTLELMAWTVLNAKAAGLTITGGQFHAPIAAVTATVDAATQRAQDNAIKLLKEHTGFGGEGMLGTDLGKQTLAAFVAMQSGDDKGLATAIGSIATSGAFSAQPITEALTAMAEAKGGFPMATGNAATVLTTHGGYAAAAAQNYATNITIAANQNDWTKVDALVAEAKQHPVVGNTTDEDKLEAHANALKAAKGVQLVNNTLSLAPLPTPPMFIAGVTKNTTDYYKGLVGKMDAAYSAGDMTALLKAGEKKTGGVAWPVNAAGEPKTANGKLTKEYHDTLVKNLQTALDKKNEAQLDAPVKVPEAGTNIGDKPAMPDFERKKIPSSNSNAGSHNSKVDTIAKLAAKGDVKGLLALNYGTNTYGKKQAALANSALAAMGSPYQVDIGQKKNSHPALTGSVTAAAAQKNAALTDKELPPKLDFMNWNGAGKGLSSSTYANQANQAAFDKLTELAKAGDIQGLKSATFQPIDKNTGSPVGQPLPIAQHPSQHVKNHQEFLLQTIDEKLNPPKPLEIFEAKQAAASVAALSAKFPPKPLGITSKKVPSSQAIGHYIAIGQVTGGEKLQPKATKEYNAQQISQGKTDYQTWKHDHLADSFRSAVQGHGGHEYHGGWDNPDSTAKGGYGKSYTGHELTERAKAAHKWARKQPPGTKIYKWENLTADMAAKLQTAQPGLIIQNPAPSCASYSPTATKGFGSSHRWTFIYTEGAKGLNSYGSGSHPGEKEVTLLPNSRYMILEHKKGTYGTPAETIVLLLPPDPALDSDGYNTGYGYGA